MDLQISSPCPLSWENLVGDNRVRYCGQCKLNVYNLAEMSPEEVEQMPVRRPVPSSRRAHPTTDATVSHRCRR